MLTKTIAVSITTTLVEEQVNDELLEDNVNIVGCKYIYIVSSLSGDCKALKKITLSLRKI